MPRGGLVERIVVLVLVVLVGSLLLGSALGQPVLLSYVKTESMSPTLEPGDGFVAIPASLAGPIEKGDVVTFRAQHLHGGGLTTHRVVGKTDQGYVTKGDNNPFTDQDGNEPPVPRSAIVAEALQVGGHVVVIPHLGTVIETLRGAFGAVAGLVSGLQRQAAILTGNRAFLGTQGLAYLLFGVGALAYLASFLFAESGNRSRPTSGNGERRPGFNATLVVVGLALLMVVAATTSMVLPSGGHTFEVVSSQNDAAGTAVIPRGSSETTGYELTNGGAIPVVVFLEEGAGVDVEPTEFSLAGGETANATVTLHAPDKIGFYPRYMTEYWYLGVLPRGAIRTLHGVHPWLPVIVIDALVGVVAALVGVATLGTGRIRFRSRDVGLADRVRRLF